MLIVVLGEYNDREHANLKLLENYLEELKILLAFCYEISSTIFRGERAFKNGTGAEGGAMGANHLV